MKISTMHYNNAKKEPMVLVTFTEAEGNTTSSVFTEEGWKHLETALLAGADQTQDGPAFVIEDES